MSCETGVVVSCEHAVNEIPGRFRHHFNDKHTLLNSHRAYDFGARALARNLADALRLPLHETKVSRLICDCNRSPRHPELFSEEIRELPNSDKDAILDRYYWSYRHRLIDEITQHMTFGRGVVHLSVHSFTPVLNGKNRKAEVGLLFDPARQKERNLVSELRRGLILHVPDLRLKNNYPYRGTADGMTSALRRVFSETRYLGLEIEVNQKLWTDDRKRWRRVGDTLVRVLAEVLTMPFSY